MVVFPAWVSACANRDARECVAISLCTSRLTTLPRIAGSLGDDYVIEYHVMTSSRCFRLQIPVRDVC